MLLGRVGTSSIPMVAGGAGKMDGRQPFQITGIYPHSPTGLIKDCAHIAHDLMIVKGWAFRVPEGQGVGLQPTWSQGVNWLAYMVPGGQRVGLHSYRVPGGQLVGLQGPRGSRGRHVGS